MRQTIVLFDMDGVLADFVSGALTVHRASLPYTEIVWDFPTQIGFAGAGDPAFWRPLETPDFWATLPPCADGMEVFRRIEARIGRDRIGILSSGLCPGSCDGKRAWLDRHLPGYARRAIFGTVKELLAAPCKLLLDDHDPNVDAWRKCGGKAVRVPRPWNGGRAQPACGDFDPDGLVRAVLEQLEAAPAAQQITVADVEGWCNE